MVHVMLVLVTQRCSGQKKTCRVSLQQEIVTRLSLMARMVAVTGKAGIDERRRRSKRLIVAVVMVAGRG